MTEQQLLKILIDLFADVEPLDVPENWEDVAREYKLEAASTMRDYHARNGIYPFLKNSSPAISYEEVMQVFKTAALMDFTHEHVANMRKAEENSADDFFWFTIDMNQEPLSKKLVEFLYVWPVIWKRGRVDPAGLLNCNEDRSVLSVIYTGLLFYVSGDSLRNALNNHVVSRLLNINLPVKLEQ